MSSVSSVSPATRAVLFDFAGTLFSDRDLRDAHLEQLRFVAEAVGVGADDAELRAAYRQGMGVAFRAIGTGPAYLHRELFGTAFAAMAEGLGGRLDAEQVNTAVERQYQATVDYARLRPGCLATLAALRGAGIHVQVVSNIDDDLLQALVDRLELKPALDAWTSSEEAASCKPDPGIFRLALSKADCAPEAALFVGDTPAHDIEGPAALGMRTAWLVADRKRDTSNVPANHVIGRLDEVPGLVLA